MKIWRPTRREWTNYCNCQNGGDQDKTEREMKARGITVVIPGKPKVVKVAA